VVQKTIERYSGKNGAGQPDVYYEVWNEPDLFGKYKLYGEKNYIDLYSHSVIGASRAGNVYNYKIGGPAITAFYDNWFEGLLTYVRKTNTRLDFYSWHRYSKNLTDYESDITKAKRILVEQFPEFKNLELIVSELGPNSAVDGVYDNNFGAMHTFATTAILESAPARGFTFEIKDGLGQAQYWGRWGILTHQKFGDPQKKPRFRALEYLNKMQGERANVAGQGSWVKSFARKSGNTLKIFVVNYDPDGKHTETVPLSLVNLPSGNFNYKRSDFNGLTRELMVATTSAVWNRMEYFDPNTASIFEIVFR
jgi:hypothetical protein